MKTKGRTAWLITWEGTECEHIGRCRIVAILPSQTGDSNIKFVLRVLFHSEYPYTLCEKVIRNVSICKDNLFRKTYRDINLEFCYGYPPKEYLSARKVKNLRFEESKKDSFENTLYWTELPKFIPNPDVDPNGPLPANLADLTKRVVGEREMQYTYSTRPSIELEKVRRAKQTTSEAT